jgi:PIN domain nuclease of toxin-antitoxin system
MSDPLLLDTCGLLWLAAGHRRLSAPARRRIDSATLVGVSAITAWEVGLKAARGELKLPIEAEEWFEGVIAHHRLQVFEITPRIAFEANRLPWHHRDPADRFILATARLHHMAVVTADDNFAIYGVETFV